MGIVTGYLSQLVTNGIKVLVGGSAVSANNPLPTTAGKFAYTKDNTGATALTASWAKVITTTTATKALRMSAACNATTYDIEYTVVTADASAPTDTRGQALLAGDDFLAGIPVGDIYARSATLQTLIIWSA
jgi:hypothetical protein